MRKLRLTIVIASILLCMPLGLLVLRAIQSVQAEKDLKHAVIAERVFDEMERELTAFLRAEEERPFEHYRYFYIRDEEPADPAPLVRSPLADLPEASFVVGHFQVEPSGTVSTPLVDGELITTPASGWQPSESLYRAINTIQSVVGEHWAGRDDAAADASGSRPIRLDRVDQAAVRSTEYLRSLNRAAFSRQNRFAQINQFTQIQNMAPPSEPRSLAMDELHTVEVILSTMAGQRIDETHFLLYRNVSANDVVFRQGLVLELPPLVDWLETRVLAVSELRGRAELALRPTTENTSDHGEARRQTYRYPHRFAEPFQDIESVLALASLPEPRGASYVYLLSALLVLTAAVGIYGLYRMVATQVAFAEKRQSFVSAVSHELRTPLTAIRMHAEMLRDGAVLDPAKRQHYYDVMTAESERLTRLVNNVLEMSRLERDGPSPAVPTAPLAPVLGQLLDTLGPHAAQEGFDLELDVADDLPDARYDPDGLLQVLFNLVDNAVKYSGAGEAKTVEIRARRRGDAVEVSVSDSGPGVAEHQIAGIFEPFQRGAAAESSNAKGSGMGLALVRRLVHAMGGTVRGENGEAGGFVVRVRLESANSRRRPGR